MARIERALEATGVMFIDQDAKAGPGVRLRKRPVTFTEMPEGRGHFDRLEGLMIGTAA